MMQAVRRFMAWPARQQRLLCEIAWALMVAAVQVRSMPFRRLAPRLGVQGQQASAQLDAAQADFARDADWMIAAMACRLPFKPTCLMQALAAKAVLGRRGIPATVYIGVAGERSPGAYAHAWVQCGQRIVTGKAEAQNYRPMVWFG